MVASLTDKAGNPGPSATATAPTADTVAPTATIAITDTALSIGETTPVTITFSEAVKGLEIADFNIENGVLSNLTTSDGGKTWTGTLTPVANIEYPTNVISLAAGTYTDLAGNKGAAATSDNFTVDTKAPTAIIAITDTALSIGETTPVTITFSEAVTGLEIADFNVENGVLSNLTTSDGGKTWTGTLTPVANIEDTTNVIRLVAGTYTDLAGNKGAAATSDNFTVDTKAPTANANIASYVDNVGSIQSTSSTAPTTDDSNVTLKGTVSGLQPGEQVNVYGNGNLLGKAIVDGTGNWTYDTATTTAGATYTVKVADAAGNTKDGSGSLAIKLDTTAPTTNATIESYIDNVGSIQSPNSKAPTTDDSNVTLKGTVGTLQPDEQVNVYANGNLLGKATVDGTGNWTYDTATTTTGATYTVKVADAAGNTKDGSKSLDIQLDNTPPAAPKVVNTNDGLVSYNEAIDSDGVITVQAEAGTKSIVVFTSANGQTVTKEFANTGAALPVKLTAAEMDQLREGNVTVSTTVVDAAGNTTVPNNTGAFTIDALPVLSKNTYNLEYFENSLVSDVVGTIKATDNVGGGVSEYKFKHSNGTLSSTSEDGAYSIDNNGNVKLTTAGGALASNSSAPSNNKFNDYETPSNNFNGYKVVAIDNAGQESATASTVNFKVNNVIAFHNIGGPDVNTTTSIIPTANNAQGGPVTTTQSQYFTTENADFVYVGYTESGEYWNGGFPVEGGSVEDTTGRNSTLNTAGGNDVIKIYRDIRDGGKVLAGAGDDTLIVGVDINLDGIVDMGTGDDVVVVGRRIGRATIDLGEGNNSLTANQINDSESTITAGAGNDIFTSYGRIEGYAGVIGIGAKDIIVNLGDGNNTITAFDDVRRAQITTGSGNDIFRIDDTNGQFNDRELDNATVNLGNGSNTVEILDGNMTSSTITTGSGNDVFNFRLDVGSSSTINTGAGDDTVTLSGSLLGGSTINLGAGNDTFIYGGTTLNGVVNGGVGIDTIELTTTDNVFTGGNNSPTNLASANFTGIEVIKMQGSNAVDIKYSELLSDTTNIGALFIQGQSNDKVDLGQNNWNSDTTASQRNLLDGSGSWSTSNTAVVEGVTYNIYHHSAAGIDLSNDVYIQQGIVVI